MLQCGTDGQTNDEQLKIELLSQWKLEAEFRNIVEKKIVKNIDSNNKLFNNIG